MRRPPSSTAWGILRSFGWLQVWILIHALAAEPAFPQQFRFEVASVRPAAPFARSADPFNPIDRPSVRGGPGTDDPERITYRGASLADLIMQSYGVRKSQLTIPERFWFRKRYDITAKILAGTSKEQFNMMIQNLLVDRFGMRLHREPKQFDAYRLVIANGGPKLTETTFKESGPKGRTDSGGMAIAAGFTAIGPKNGHLALSAGKTTMPKFTTFLETLLHSPVTDATGLTGEYDIKMELSSEGLTMPGATGNALSNQNAASASDPAPSIFQALEKRLGLKLEKSKVTLDLLIVDHLDDVPTDN
jgi:uncharacterized protein (TIGR03435 family)